MPTFVLEQDLQNYLAQTALPEQGWVFNPIHTSAELKDNFADKLTRINRKINPDFIALTKEDINLLLHQIYSQSTLFEAQQKATQQSDIYLTRSNGELERVILYLDDPAENYWEVATEYTANGSKNRFDIIHLRNGLPVALGELKNHDVSTFEAYAQVERYRKESLKQDKLLALAPITYVSNGADTKYMSTAENPRRAGLSQIDGYKLELNNWGNQESQTATSIEDFVRLFLKTDSLHGYLSTCVLFKEDTCILLRYYQAYGKEAILNKIVRTEDNNPRLSPSHEQHHEVGGYLAHSTGSGKTFTLTATAREISQRFPQYTVFVLTDRVELGSQMNAVFKDYLGLSGFVALERGRDLPEILSSSSRSLILGSHQTVNSALRYLEDGQPLTERRTIILYEEGHRSQAGRMTQEIRERLPKAQFFAVTGTPVTASNPINGHTTGILFGERLHWYSMADATRDGNTVPIMLTECSPISVNREALATELLDMREGRERYSFTLESAEIQRSVTRYIAENLEDYQSIEGAHGEREKMVGILATKTMRDAVLYSEIFRDEHPHIRAFVYASQSEDELVENAIHSDYLRFCEMFNISPRNDNWRSHYYNELRSKAEQADVDLLVVVRVFLTGYDNPRVNTLWLDKELTSRELIQSISRTNRPYPGKTQGNAVAFVRTEQNLKEAMREFGGMSENEILEATQQLTLEQLLRGESGLIALSETIRENCSQWYGRNPVEELGERSRELANIFEPLSQYARQLKRGRNILGFRMGVQGTLSEDEWQQAEGLLGIIKTHFRAPSRNTNRVRRDISSLVIPRAQVVEQTFFGVDEMSPEGYPVEAPVAPPAIGRSRLRLPSSGEQGTPTFAEGEEAQKLVEFLHKSLALHEVDNSEILVLWTQQMRKIAQEASQVHGVSFEFLYQEMRKYFTRPNSPSLASTYDVERPSRYIMSKYGIAGDFGAWYRLRDLMYVARDAGRMMVDA